MNRSKRKNQTSRQSKARREARRTLQLQQRSSSSALRAATRLGLEANKIAALGDTGLSGQENALLVWCVGQARINQVTGVAPGDNLPLQIIELMDRLKKARSGFNKFALSIHSELISHGIDDEIGNAIARIRKLGTERNEALSAIVDATGHLQNAGAIIDENLPDTEPGTPRPRQTEAELEIGKALAILQGDPDAEGKVLEHHRRLEERLAALAVPVEAVDDEDETEPEEEVTEEQPDEESDVDPEPEADSGMGDG